MREDRPSSHQQLGRTFITQQRVIALLSFFLPVSLIGWSLISGEGLRGSISEYYYTPMRDVFVGTLCALALFLWSYRGYHPTNPELRADRIVAKVASIAAALVALAPLQPRQAEWDCTVLQCVIGVSTTYWLHNVAASVFLLALATFCLILFPMSAIPEHDLGPRLVAYGISGATIVISVLLMVLWTFLPVEIYFMLGRYKPILMLETIAMVAFAWSWFLRSRAVEHAALARFRPPEEVAA
ncbi:hypothetical protein [Tessaracoccus sp. ZS01]|uniref:hypothetical protein n=1 Tax=Tessaracoccus sp. ZS01 TaxID=1906324 RepID=UPI00117C2AC0|nr:hypothetical protein [Tessaracoccus sp. ZS01]